MLLQLIDQRAFGLGHGLVDGDGQTVLPRSRCFAQPVTLHARFCAPRSFSLHAVTVIDLESRRVHIAGLVRDPHAAWIQQIARNLTASVDGFLRGKRYLIHDRDPLFTAAFRANLCAAGIECLKLPLQSPNLNSFAERFVLSIKKECLSKLVPLGARHLRFVISEFVAHYHLERNHQGLDNRLITAIAAPANDN
ncbi:MAG: integrase core domain-containing protein, partial [Kofleriaceae bacterium]